jgi:dihydroxyacetone kinase-like protein
MGLTAAHLKSAAAAIALSAEAAAEQLNAQDALLGDGDLGITVAKGWRAVAGAASAFPDDVGQSFLISAKAFQQVSSSSFGTLVATAFIAVAKKTRGRSEVPWSEIPALVAAARDAMIERGKGSVGDKSVLDSLDAVIRAVDGIDDPPAMLAAADRAAEQALAAYRDRPSRLGRARMFAEKSVGLDDPGMMAFRRILDGLTSGSRSERQEDGD